MCPLPAFPPLRACAGGGGGCCRPLPGDPDYIRPADPYKRQRLVDDAGSIPYGGERRAGVDVDVDVQKAGVSHFLVKGG